MISSKYISRIAVFTFTALLFSCAEKKTVPAEKSLAFQNKGHKLIYTMLQKVGDQSKLAEKKNVTYTITKVSSSNNSSVINEKYIFENELSYGEYSSFSKLEGKIEQGYDGNEFWLKHNGEIVNDEALLKRVKFNRKTNFYWFCMLQKLLDPSVIYEHVGEKIIDHQEYDIVKISFEPVGDTATDIYQLYINKKTALVDQFLYTVADFGKFEKPNLTKLEYENIDGILIPTKRKSKNSTWDADESDKVWSHVNWSDIKFNNDLSVDDFKK